MSTHTATAPTFAQSVWLVAEREIGSKLRSKAFLISFGILFALALAGVIWAGFSAKSASTTPVAVTADSAQHVANVPGLELTEVADQAAAEALVADGTVDAAIVGDGAAPLGFSVVVESDVPSGLLMSLSQSPNVVVLDPAGATDWIGYIAAIGFGIVFLFAAQTFGATIAQSVVEEKQTRVVELLISSIPARALLAGKVVGNTVLAMGQVLVLAAIAVVGLTVTGQTEFLQGIGGPIAWFSVFFLFGFVLLAALFAAAAAMVSRQEDIGSTTTPLMFLILAPYFLVIFFWNNPTVLSVMSYVPFSAPVGMPVRLFLGQAQWWEPLVSLAIMLVTCVAAIWVGAKIYENSILRMGARVKLSEAIAG
ncbi:MULTISPECIES: ABC transporter permease [unclassified Microbacterium]|uniref:ABC transporter permease n=1 Tax=unclassified Microbacterium TaxID=2609290 RepID=UPI00301627A5